MSTFSGISLAELSTRAHIVVLAFVKEVRTPPQLGPTECVLEISDVLRGNLKEKEVTLTNQVGWSKGFDPALQKGQSGVFFFESVTGGHAKLAYSAAMAIFEKPVFKSTH